jgi:2-keto-4-pentenoate hydratase/2-oxohepta-3-ene-1,7-dioic acid hydratase in catechol pathway
MRRPSRLERIRQAVTGSLSVIDPRQPIGPDDLFPDDGETTTAPRIARFLGDDGSPRVGVVLESIEGVPNLLLDLTARYGLPSGFLEMVAAGGLEAAEQALEEYEPNKPSVHHVRIERGELAHRILSPVDIDQARLDSHERLVVGFGLTFRTHQEETSLLQPIVFPKPAVPTGAYAPVPAGVEPGRRGATPLLDYELELGCVALRDLDLDRLDELDTGRDFGYLVINDVSARGPILRDRRSGYARAKGRPGYLPAGPWVVPGEHFVKAEPSVRRMVLTVDETEPDPAGGAEQHTHGTLRQNALLEDLTLGLRELLELIGARRTLTMAGTDGRRWPISIARDGRRIVPAGSLLLTGTPGGTAIRSPDAGDRLSLVLRSLRHLRWPSESYRQHLEGHYTPFGFLSPGDRVSGWITGLGRQEWEVE